MPDAIIAGAGPVGLLLGCLLAGRGAEVLIIERRRGADERSRAIGIHPPGLAALDAAGIGAAVRAEAVALDGGEVHARGRMLAAVPFGAARPVLTLAQHRTDALLRARLHALGGTIRSGTAVVGFRDEGSRVRVRTTDGELPTPFLVVADGVRSALRRAAGVGWIRRGRSAHYAMIDIPDPGEDRLARIHCEPGGLVESFPLPAGQRRWVIRRTDGGDAVTSEVFAEAILARTDIGIRIPDGLAPTAFTAAQHRADHLARGRVALLGDAAHEVSPIGGQGMNLGWADAVMLAPLLIDGLHGTTVDLRGYARRASARAAGAQRRSAFYMDMGSPASRPAQRAREVAIRALGSVPLRERAAALVTMGGL
ncbi:2-polyprenyl-6-methoxyphenol hydroxylase-like FAD-dependent oxidoreductase [Microbacterium sp. W4I4]|uniref:FAD-dependent oxidoreductase n=1 Tax=Microbacterium sp. W4I4 TaxID=3042295 RepID=UPI002783B58A|nr:NAD(P)/FAD-dependent oxidoreductase [Microbacterium sp. W4I4]MDQ0612432.1 2-polyprenyl-6-methoxyphenol hydroxylase-like FAD-dependent oxidoreductase [Microbacterium sp. W4I4]